MTELVKYSEACRAIAEAKAVDEVSTYRNKADAMRLYAHQAKNKQLEVDAAEIRFRAERKLGQLIKLQKESVGLATGAAGIGKSESAVPEEYRTQPPTLAEAGIDKKLSSKAQKLAAIPEEEFEETISEWRDKVEKENERVTVNLLRKGERAEKAERQNVAPPQGKYSLIYADPPWRYEHSKTESRAIENQYPTMDLQEICDLPVGDVAADDCVLFMWATSPKLAESFEVLTAWGFTYRTCAVWDKEKIGMGYYFRQQHELLLVAAKGKPGTPDPSARISSVYREARGIHSRKPQGFYDVLNGMYPEATKLELFCRTPQEGWSVWGNEVA